MPTLTEITSFIVAVSILLAVVWLHRLTKPISQYLVSASFKGKRIRRLLKRLSDAKEALPKPDAAARKQR
jgi:hypothetical protein